MNLTSNQLKIIALTAMAFDHTMSWLIPSGTYLFAATHTIGRIVAPLICYFIAEGYHYTSDVKKYIRRLFFFAVLSHFPYVYLFDLTWYKATGAMWGLALGLLALHIVKGQGKLLFKILSLVIICYLARPGDWNYIAVLWIVAFGVFRGSFEKQIVAFLTIGLTLYIIPMLMISPLYYYRVFILLAIPLLAMYKGQQGKKSNLLKWSMYVFYPFHLAVLCVLKYVVQF